MKEVLLVSENTSSYGKDLPGVNLETLLPQLSRVDGLEWIRVSPGPSRTGMSCLTMPAHSEGRS